MEIVRVLKINSVIFSDRHYEPIIIQASPPDTPSEKGYSKFFITPSEVNKWELSLPQLASLIDTEMSIKLTSIIIPRISDPQQLFITKLQDRKDYAISPTPEAENRILQYFYLTLETHCRHFAHPAPIPRYIIKLELDQEEFTQCTQLQPGTMFFMHDPTF